MKLSDRQKAWLIIISGVLLLAVVVLTKYFLVKRATTPSFANCGYQVKVADIKLPDGLSWVGRLVYSQKYERLFLVGGEADKRLALWSFQAGEFKRLIAIPDSNYQTGEGLVHLDSQDNLYFEINAPHHFYRSADGGQTWQLISQGAKEVFWSIADNGQGELYGTAWSADKPLLYLSRDQGLTWQAWLDFHKIFPDGAAPSAVASIPKMRHLHDVAVYGNKILVGTGDEARASFLSTDRGRTWQEVWNEGFTAHAFIKNTGQIILGGDRADRYGLSFYDFNDSRPATATWNQNKDGWSAYVYSLLSQNNRYYAGVHAENGAALRYGVLVSCDGRAWSPLLTWQADAAKDTTVYLAASSVDGFFLSRNGELYFASGVN